MSSTDIYQPYTYLIGWSKHNLWYYGVRFAKGCNPADLWVRYFTSSKLVAKCRCKYGEPDVVTIRRTFKCRTSAIDWEQKVLRRLKVVKSHMWLNCSASRQNHDKIDQAARNLSTFQTHNFRQKQSSSMKELYSNALKDMAYRETNGYKEKQSISTQNSYRQGKKQPSPTHTRGVEVDGIAYGSVTEAAKTFGVTDGTVLRRIKSPKTPSWKYVNDGVPHTPGLGRRPVRVDGITYPSVSDAARTFNISVKAAYNRFNKDTWPDWTYL